MEQYRQGDVLLERIDALPEEAFPVDGRTILAYGEVTGHAHEVKKYGRLFESAGQRFLKVTRKTSLEHQEHGSIPLTAGIYRIIQQREYHPEAIRNVAD